VFDTLFGQDASFRPQLQMLAGSTTSADGKQWELTLRGRAEVPRQHAGAGQGLRRLDPAVSASGDPLGIELGKRIDEISAPSDKMIRIRLKATVRPAADGAGRCMPTAHPWPERVARTDPFQQIPEGDRQWPVPLQNVAERVSGSRRGVRQNSPATCRAPDGVAELHRRSEDPPISIVSNGQTPPDPATCAPGRLLNKEVDWWENPTIDLVPQLKRDKTLTIRVIDITGAIGCLRFKPSVPAVRQSRRSARLVLSAVDQSEFMQAGRRRRARA